jgi:cell division transport system permease protein
MTLALLVVGSLIIMAALQSYTLNAIKNNVDVNVYFVSGASDSDMQSLVKQIEALPEVASTKFSTSADELAAFKARHANDELTLQALDEVGDNPFGAALEIKAKDPAHYQSIANFLDDQKKNNASSVIDKVNYARNKEAIDALTNISEASRTLGLAVVIFFAGIAFLITFNTIRLTIYMAREEISVKRLVGASTRYIKGPFVVSGLMYGAAGTILALVLLLPLAYWAGPYTAKLNVGSDSGFNVFGYLVSHIFQVIGIFLASGLGIGALSSYLAVKKYLKI